MKEVPPAKFHPAELANAALDAGINYFDTAPAYGNGQSERNYGEVLATRRNEVFLSTKTGNRSYDGAMREVEASLKRLHTDRLDLLQIHGIKAKEDFTKWDKPDGVLKALYKLRDEKVTRFIGVTGHESAESMRRAIELFDFDTVLTTVNQRYCQMLWIEFFSGSIAEPLRPPKADFDIFISPASKARFIKATACNAVTYLASAGG